jgi:hypothetical protein
LSTESDDAIRAIGMKTIMSKFFDATAGFVKNQRRIDGSILPENFHAFAFFMSWKSEEKK